MSSANNTCGQIKALNEMYNFHLFLIGMSNDELIIFKGNNEKLINDLIELLK